MNNFTKQETLKFFKMADGCYKCYQRALEVDRSCTKLWIEVGNILYNVASHVARMKKTAQYLKARQKQVEESEILLLKTKHKECLNRALNCFTSASQLEPEDDESWLPFYLMGKIHEKHNVMKALYHYELADLHLFNNGANYPKKISYYNPPWLAHRGVGGILQNSCMCPEIFNNGQNTKSKNSRPYEMVSNEGCKITVCQTE